VKIGEEKRAENPKSVTEEKEEQSRTQASGRSGVGKNTKMRKREGERNRSLKSRTSAEDQKILVAEPAGQEREMGGRGQGGRPGGGDSNWMAWERSILLASEKKGKQVGGLAPNIFGLLQDATGATGV